MLDLVRSAIGSFRIGIAWKGRRLDESMRYLVRVAMGYWSTLELAATWVFLEIISCCCWYALLEVVTLYLPWSPLEVGAGNRIGADSCSGTTGLGCDNTLGNADG